MKNGIRVYATKEAKEKYEGKIVDKVIGTYCPSCEIQLNKKKKQTKLKGDI